MVEHTAVCDCGMPIVIDTKWVGRYVHCPHCERDFIVQSNLTVLPPDEAVAAAKAFAQAVPGAAPSMPPPGVPFSHAVSQPVDTGDDLDITLSEPESFSEEPSDGNAMEVLPVTPASDAPPPPTPPPPPPGATLPPGFTAGPPIEIEFDEDRWMPLTSLIIGAASLPAVLLWGIGSLILGATALVLGSDSRRRSRTKPWMPVVGMICGAGGIAASVAYWLLWWWASRGG